MGQKVNQKEEEEPEEAAAGEALENNEETTEQIIDNPVEEWYKIIKRWKGQVRKQATFRDITVGVSYNSCLWNPPLSESMNY